MALICTYTSNIRDILDLGGHSFLKQDLEEYRNFMILPASVWNHLIQWYGMAPQQ
jgi:hypothetical protein